MRDGRASATSLKPAGLLLCLFAFVFAAATSAPLRPQGGDTVAGRLAMVTLACDGRSDLAMIDWLRRRAEKGRLPYYARLTTDQGSIASIFGPGPGWLGWPFFAQVEHGRLLDDRMLQSRARFAASTAVASSAVLLAIGLLATASWPWAVGAAATAGLSFAGAATLGQGLWQQTAALPFFMLAFAMAAWCSRFPRLLAVALTSAVMAAWLRPPDVLLAIGISIQALLQVQRDRIGLGSLAISLLGLVVASVALGSWNLWYYDQLWPVGQWAANQLATDSVLNANPGHFALALLGLLASPARGLVLFAPVVLLAIGLCYGRPAPERPAHVALAAALVAQLVLCSLFYKWWGGLAFGPRLLGISTWLGIALLVRCTPTAVSNSWKSWKKTAVVAAMAQTLLIGLVGLWLYDPRKWEIPNDPDRNPQRLFDLRQSQWSTLFKPVPSIGDAIDAPVGPFYYCDPSGLRSK